MTRLFVLVALAALVLPTTAPAATAEACGLSGSFRVYSSRIDYDTGGAGAMPSTTRQLVLSGSRWQFGPSSGSFRVSPITAADWSRWGVEPYGPTKKIVLSGWGGGSGDGPIESEGNVVNFFWLIYPARPPTVSAPATVSLKLGHATVPKSCDASEPPAVAGTARLTIAPSAVAAGKSVRVSAGPFQPGEELAITDTYTLNGSKRTSSLLGGAANSTGMIAFSRTTVPQTPLGRHTLCVTGTVSKRRACGSFTVTRGTAGRSSTPSGASGGYNPPTVGPGYEPPGSKP